ncbi:MAG: GNAT family N-acetyltransferase [Segetibacter sp.]|nr:GNAT family N-acetyltransferase [Segetibacter sp.]
MVRVEKIEDENGLDKIRKLFKEYLEELNENLCFQRTDEELMSPLKKYGPPHGSLLLAYIDDKPAGCIALQRLKEEGVCEMKRLYVRPCYRSNGIADALVEKLLAEAKQKGYKKMVLDTLERLQPAIKLYLKHGFVNTSAYYQNPLPGVVYMQRSLIT